MNKVKWGVLGTADIAKRCTIPGMQQAENCELYAVAGRSMEKAEKYRDEFGFTKAYGSLDNLLNDNQIQAVYIPLPNELHYEWTIKALKAGKHVLCEKPLAPTAEKRQEMFQTARDNGVILMEAFAYLHSPFISAVKAELDAGTIGEIRYMDSTFITSDYSLSNIRMRKETYGGSTYDLGCYTTSMILWMLGEEPETVKAIAEFSKQGIDTYTTGIFTYPDGKKAAFSCGMVLATDQDKRIDRLEIHGTKGAIYSKAEFNQEGEMAYTVVTDDKTEIKTVIAPQNYRLEIEQMNRCITEGESPLLSEKFSLQIANVLEKILEEIGY